MFILVPVRFSKHLSPTLPDFILIWQSPARQTETDARPNNVRMSGRAKTHKTFDTPCFVSAVPSCRGKIARCLFSSVQVVINKFEKPLPVQPMRFRVSRSMEQCYRIAPRLQFCPYSRRKAKVNFGTGIKCWAEPFQHLWSDVLCLLRLSLHECIGRSSWDCHPPDNLLKGSKRQSKRVHVSGSA